MIFFWQIVISLVLGVIAGTFTGLIPGIHINFVALMVSASAGFLLNHFTAMAIVSFIVSMAVTHSFLDFVPSIFLSAPNAETALSVMPGHNLLLRGHGYAAVRLASIGGYIGLIILVLASPLFIYGLPLLYGILKNSMAFVLIAASLYLIIADKDKLMAFFVFILSGVLGFAALNLPVNQPLFPLLSGLFGTSMLFASISDKAIIPKQKIGLLKIETKEKTKTIFAGLISSGLCSFLPGLGASQAAVIGSEISGKISGRGFLMLLGIISTLVTGLNFVAIYAIGKPRSGVAVAAEKILQSMNLQQLYLLLIVAFVAGSIALPIALFSARIFARNISRINYSKISCIIILFISVVCFAFSGIIGLLILATSTALGIFAIKMNVRKMHLMGCLMLPVILYFL